MAVTIRDIARTLGVSHATVSRALNHRKDPFISDATRQRVIEAARSMGYRTNISARALITGKTFNIGLLVESMQERTDPHLARMIQSLEPKARSLGYRVGLFGDLESVLGESSVDGVVVLADPDEPRFSPLLDSSTSIFVIPRSTIAARCVSWSDWDGASNACRYLANLGHKSIVAIFGDIPQDIAVPKVEGFRQAAREVGAQWQEYSETLSTDQFSNGYLLGKELLRDMASATAIFCRNDFLALGAMKAIREAGMQVPRDVSVIGYSDTVLAHCADPALTSVRTPIGEAGEMAVEQLVRAIETGVMEFPGVTLPTSITVRESCAPRS